MRKGAFIEYAKNLKVGTHFHVGRNTFFCAHAPITYGDHVTFSLNCTVLTMHHSGDQHQYEHYPSVGIVAQAIIYAGATILPGSVVESGQVIRAGSSYSNTHG
jgi:acetyltransferase-like isoleucine patch superfamily enzyme